MDLRIAFKMVACFFLMFLIAMCLGAILLLHMNRMSTNAVRQVSSETAKSVGNNLDFLFTTLNNQSIIILSSQVVQNALVKGTPDTSYLFQRQMTTYFADSMNFNQMISAIYVFDLHGDTYYVDNSAFKGISLRKMAAMPWFPRVVAQKGKYLVELNGGGTFSADQNYVSLIRVINNIDTQKPIGYMMVNVSADYLKKSILEGNNTSNMAVVLRDEAGRDVVAADRRFSRALDGGLAEKGGSVIRKVGGEEYVISGLSNDFGWQLACITPLHDLTAQAASYRLFLLLFLLLTGFLLLATFFLVSLLISSPIHKLALSINATEAESLQEVRLNTGRDEIGTLKDVYNSLVHKIEVLIENIIKEQALKRQKELEVLQAEIKPHFLYNSFDAISSLVLTGDNEQAYNLIGALGTFYKSFLNAGHEESTVGRELEIVDSYLTIQKFRFGDKFTVVREIDENAFGYGLPRMTLQPLVENALNHGIRGRKGQGTLTLRVRREDSNAVLAVQDDGAGMEPEKVWEILEGRCEGVGLRATIERLNLFFNRENTVEIESKKGVGTTVTLTIPGKQETEHGN